MTPSQRIRGLRVLVTGGSSGIGLSVAQQLVDHHAQVAILARGQAGLADAAQRTGAFPVTADVTDPAQTKARLDEAAQRLHGLDAVVACAGAAAYGPFSEMQPEEYERTVQITLLGVLNTTYAAAKHGVRGFMRSLDAELRAQRRPVSLALVAPGPVDTPFRVRARTPDRRLPPEIRGAYPPEDVAREVIRALAAPQRLERSVGGLMNLAIAADSLAPNLIQLPLGVAARIGWRARERRPVSRDDALEAPTRSAERSGGLTRHRSILQRLRDRIGP